MVEITEAEAAEYRKLKMFADFCRRQFHPCRRDALDWEELAGMVLYHPTVYDHIERRDFSTKEWWQALSIENQFLLAERIAANLGYELTPEPEHPDSPHNPDRLRHIA